LHGQDALLLPSLGVPAVIDGGGITAPSLAFYDLNGRWAVENEGVAPDIEVENGAADVIKGHDPQLERAVHEALKLLEQNPVQRVPRPAPIDRVSRPRGSRRSREGDCKHIRGVGAVAWLDSSPHQRQQPTGPPSSPSKR
jgi:hypothetical protein